MSDIVQIPKDPLGQKYYATSLAPAWGISVVDKVSQIVWVRCPECHTTADLHHEIADDGTVTPSIWHQCGTSGANDSGQDWHIWGRLLDWPNAAPNPNHKGGNNDE